MKMQLSLSQTLKLVRHGLTLGNVQAAIDVLSELIPQVEAREKADADTAESLDKAGM